MQIDPPIYAYYLVYFCWVLFWLSCPLLYFFYKNIDIHPIAGRLPHNTMAIHIGWLLVSCNELWNSLYVEYYYGVVDILTTLVYFDVLYFFIYRLLYLLLTSQRQANAITQDAENILKWEQLNRKLLWFYWIIQPRIAKRIFLALNLGYAITCFICLGIDPLMFTTVYSEGLNNSVPYSFCIDLGLAIFFIELILMVILVVKIHALYEDAFWMKTEASVTTYFTAVALLTYVILSAVFPQSRWIASLPIFCVGFFMVFTGTIWPYILSREEKEKLLIANSKRELLAIISTDEGFQAFLIYLRSEFSSENLIFWQQVEAFKIQEGDIDALQQTVLAINSQFIVNNSPYQINISSEIQLNIIAKIHKIKEIADRNELLQIFDGAQTCIYNLMKADTYPRFQRNSTYCANLSRASKSRNSQTTSNTGPPSIVEDDTSLLV